MISFVYFDIGGVLIQDFSANNNWQEFEKEIGVSPDNSQAFVEFWDSHEDEVCKGRDTEEVFSEAKERFDLKVPVNYSVLDGFAKRFKPNSEIWEAVDEARKKYKVGLLTNMYPGMLDIIFKMKIMPEVEWDVIVDSSIVHAAKPDVEIFEIAEKKADINGGEILFIDNGKRHIEAARRFGWKTFLYDPSNFKKSSVELMTILK